MNYQMLIIFGMNISDTTGYQMAIYAYALLEVCFCTTLGKQNKQNSTFLINSVSSCDLYSVR